MIFVMWFAAWGKAVRPPRRPSAQPPFVERDGSNCFPRYRAGVSTAVRVIEFPSSHYVGSRSAARQPFAVAIARHHEFSRLRLCNDQTANKTAMPFGSESGRWQQGEVVLS